MVWCISACRELVVSCWLAVCGMNWSLMNVMCSGVELMLELSGCECAPTVSQQAANVLQLFSVDVDVSGCSSSVSCCLTPTCHWPALQTVTDLLLLLLLWYRSCLISGSETCEWWWNTSKVRNEMRMTRCRSTLKTEETQSWENYWDCTLTPWWFERRSFDMMKKLSFQFFISKGEVFLYEL